MSEPNRDDSLRRRAALVDSAACAWFVVVVVVLERGTVAGLRSGESPLPNPLWHLFGPLAIVAVSLLLSRRARFGLLGFAGLALTLLFALDRAYHGFFATVPSAFMLATMSQLLEVDDSVGAMIGLTDLLPAIAFVPLFWFAYRPPNEGPARPFRARLLPASAVAAATVLLVFVAQDLPIYEKTHHVGRSPWVKAADHWGSRFSRLSRATTFGLFNYHVTDLRDYARSSLGRGPLAEQARADLEARLDHKATLNARPSPLAGIARGRHVVLIQLESLQHFLLDLEIGGQEVTPRLNALARTALRFDYIFDVTHIGRTSDAEFAVMTGLLPDIRKPAAFSRFDPNLVALPKRLTDAGYETTSIHGFKPGFWNRAESHPAFGIQDMVFGPAFDPADSIGLGPSDRQVFARAAELLDAHRETPQFHFLISLTSHHPYLETPTSYVLPYRHLRPDDGFGLLAHYLGAATYTDEAVGTYLDLLADQGLLEESLIVIYGDHDRGGLGEERAPEEIGPRLFEMTEDRVPFLVLIPGEEERIAAVQDEASLVMGGLQDTFPTILHLLGEPVPRGLLGTHLFVPNQDRDAFPLPAPAGAFGHRGHLALGDGRVIRSKGAVPGPPTSLTPEEVLQDRRVLEQLLDHYDEIAADWAEAPVPAAARP